MTEDGPVDKRSVRTYTRPQLDKIGDCYYYIASDIFDVTEQAKKMSEEEVKEMPVKVIYSGPVIDFLTDEKECFTLLMEIIKKFNLMQSDEFYSFPLGIVFISFII